MQFDQAVAGDAPRPGASPLPERPPFRPVAAFRLLGAPVYVRWDALALNAAWLALAWYLVHQHGVTDTQRAAGLVIAVWAILPIAVLLHELGHFLACNAAGVPVRFITLHGLGGATHPVDHIESPGRQFVVSLAGPAVNVSIALVAAGLYYHSGLPLGDDARFVVFQVMVINALLSIDNLLPVFPNDGSQVLRTSLMMLLGVSPETAATIAKYSGRVLVAVP